MRPAKLYIGSSSSDRFWAARYRWEFLRRNPRYRADYQHFVNSFQKWFVRHGYWYDEQRRRRWSKSTKLYFETKIEPSLSKLCRKWDVFDLFSSECGCDADFDETGPRDRPFTIPTDEAPASTRDYRSARRVPARIDVTWEMGPALLRENLLTVRFNLDWPMKDLQEHASHILKFARRSYQRQFNDKGGKRKTGRRRLEDFDLHLKVWDLFERGMRNQEIVKALFPQDSPGVGQRKVRDHLHAARRLIFGHYKEIK
jgi:hypothetical protein